MSGGFNLDDYNTVAERLTDFRERFPHGRILTEIQELPPAYAEKFIAVKASVWRDEGSVGGPPDGTGLAWEPVPGTTPFTKSSELMVGETSAVGRALVNALVADTKKGIASREEVSRATGKRDAESVKGGRPSGGGNPVAPSRSGGKSSIPPSKDETTDATSPLSTTPKSSVPGPGKAAVEGKQQQQSTAPASASCKHEQWEPAPNKDAADRGYMVCKKCRVSKKDPV